MKKNPKIVIIDYGVGNLYSIYKAAGLYTDKVLISNNTEDIKNADALILPGDGAFKAGMAGLKERKILKEVGDFSKSGKPVLGICLGAQILLATGLEFGRHSGLGVIPGNVVKFSNLKKGSKVPQIGWNTIKPTAKGKNITGGLGKDPYFYFVHSYIMEPTDKDDILATSSYGGQIFSSIVGRGNIIGCQFHPEKSGQAGLKLIQNFVNLIR